ncbi:hypothetical protein NPIL_151541 [Nephila pilipes]|uniref:Uncharacterized protein n=1 Tax=Nephila pilipes TaxID=299642 RepID=A0A8X6TS94_NEPPI|nr:hypothetical protein NPIL_151541 [Nephila pilipes]
MVTFECIIPQEYHPTVLSIRGSKEQNVRRQFNVTIKLNYREKPEDADKVMMNGDAHADDFEAEFQANFEAQRDNLRKDVKPQKNLEDENRKTCNLRRRKPKSYRVGDLCRLEEQLSSGRPSSVVLNEHSRPTSPPEEASKKSAARNQSREDDHEKETLHVAEESFYFRRHCGNVNDFNFDD